MFSLVFFYSITPIALAAEEPHSCHTCASSDLQNRWYLTGLPQLPNDYFTECDLPKVNKPCEGSCFTYMFQDPDEVPILTAYLFVRGCHTTLTQTVSNRVGNASSNSDFCEYDDYYPLVNSRGEAVNVKALVDFCSGTLCNTIRDATNCKRSSTNQIQNNQLLHCNECRPINGKKCNKNEEECSKKYCTKEMVMLDSGYQLVKSCSDINLFGIDNKCMTYNIKSAMGNVASRTKYTKCYCRDKQFCNITASPTYLSSIFLAALLTFKF